MLKISGLTSTWLFHSTFCNVTKETKWSRPFLTNFLKIQKSSSSSVQYSTLFAEIIVFLNVACLAYHWAKHDKIFYTKPIPCDKMLIGVYFQHNLSWTLIICFRYQFSVYFLLKYFVHILQLIWVKNGTFIDSYVKNLNTIKGMTDSWLSITRNV